MREQLRDAAPYVSVFGLVLLVASVVVRFLPNLDPNIALGLSGVGAILLLAWPVLAWEDFKGLLGSRRARFGTNSLLLAVAVLVGLVAVYFLGTRFYYTQDLTTNQQFTLQNQTLQILNGLKDANRAVQLTAVLALQDPQQKEDELRRLVERYTQRNPQVTLTVVRPDRDAAGLLGLAGRLQKDPNQLVNTLVAESGGKNAIVYSFDEQGVTEAILKATRDQVTNIYFTTGHGEPGTSGENGYGALQQALEREGYLVKTVDLATMTETLKAGDVVVIGGPTKAFPEAETRKLDQFVKDKGSVLMMLGTPFELGPGVPPDLGLAAVLAPWALQLGNDLVIDPAGNAILGRPTFALAQGAEGFPFHTITKDLTTTRAVFPNSRSLTAGSAVTTSLTSTALAKTGPEAWAETDLASLQGNNPAADAGEQGPVNLGFAAEGGTSYGRLVVFGSSQFASDGFLNATAVAGFSNGSLVLNAVNWLAADEELISIKPTAPESRQLSPPQSPVLLWWFIAVILPLVVLAVGVWMWWRRR